jgi:hypothetical protein
MLSKDPVARAAGIVYTTKTGDHYIFSDEVVLGPFKDETNRIFRIIANIDAWWLIDGKEQGPFATARCNIVLAASPDKDNYNELVKEGYLLWMPVWDRDAETSSNGISPELEMLRRELFPHVTSEDMISAVNVWGPVPRHVLVNVYRAGGGKMKMEQQANVEQQANMDRVVVEQQANMDRVIVDASVDDLMKLFATENIGSVPETLSYKLLLPIVNRANFFLEDYRVASNYVAQRVVQRIVQCTDDYFLEFEQQLRSHQRDPFYKCLWGDMYAAWFHRLLLSKGGTFPCRQVLPPGCDTDNNPSITPVVRMTSVNFKALRSKAVRVFASSAELQQLTDLTENCLWLPSSSSSASVTFPAVDSILVYEGAVYLFQCSRYANRGYNDEGITGVWESLSQHVREHVKGLYLVVPSKEIFDAVTWQKLVGQGQSTAGKARVAPNDMRLPKNTTTTTAGTDDASREESKVMMGKPSVQKCSSTLLQNTAAAASASSSAMTAGTEVAAGVSELVKFPEIEGLRQWKMLSVIDPLTPTAPTSSQKRKKTEKTEKKGKRKKWVRY